VPTRIVFSDGDPIIVDEDTDQVRNIVKNRSREFVPVNRYGGQGSGHEAWINSDQILYFEEYRGERGTAPSDQ
jgi:hypothetical protein